MAHRSRARAGVSFLIGFLAGAALPVTATPHPERNLTAAKMGIPIGTHATSADGTLTLTLRARFQLYQDKPKNPNDYYDADVHSPKSAKFLPAGERVYVNALEGYATLVYDPIRLEKISKIIHRFDGKNQHLFSSQPPFDYQFRVLPATARVNHFGGKPVEMELTHGGRYLWISYYRRHYDNNALGPSAVAVIDTSTDRIVKVLPSGPIPKILAASPDGQWLAMIHWGDNTVGFVDISASAPEDFDLSHLVVVQKRFQPKTSKNRGKIDRDKECGLCLRGAVFTPDSTHLIVAALGGGGIAVINVTERRTVGLVKGIKPTPRHLILELPKEPRPPEWLYVSSNRSGYVSKVKIDKLLAAAYKKENKSVKPAYETYIGGGVRTIALSPDGRWLYAAVNWESRLVALRAADLTKVAEVPVDSFPVGLAVSPDGSQVWVTSQGRQRRGGHSVSVYGVEVNE
ncbi:MAG: beta-propeller fold lactonase family protein [Terriglobia bacterium]